jgi:acid phosphatase family membrane protein YuiD
MWILAWVGAQIIKTLLFWLSTNKFNLERLTGAGGMPSSHSATVCALAIGTARVEGFQSTMFAFALAFAGIVMFDAMGIRRAAGEQAKVLNQDGD